MTERGGVGRLGRAAAITLVAGTVGGAALLAGEALVARARRYAQPPLGLAPRDRRRPAGAPRCGWCCSATRPRSASASSGSPTRSAGSSPACCRRHRGRASGCTLSSVGVSGSRSTDLATQVARALLGDRPDVAVMLIGANDATAAAPARRGRRLPGRRRAPAARRRCRGGRRHLPRPGRRAARSRQPLRQVAGLVGRRMARAQTAAVLAAGGTVVDLGAETGAVFRADAGTLCYDGFHPSADGYRVWAHALLPGGARPRRRAARRV